MADNFKKSFRIDALLSSQMSNALKDEPEGANFTKKKVNNTESHSRQSSVSPRQDNEHHHQLDEEEPPNSAESPENPLQQHAIFLRHLHGGGSLGFSPPPQYGSPPGSTPTSGASNGNLINQRFLSPFAACHPSLQQMLAGSAFYPPTSLQGGSQTNSQLEWLARASAQAAAAAGAMYYPRLNDCWSGKNNMCRSRTSFNYQSLINIKTIVFFCKIKSFAGKFNLEWKIVSSLIAIRL